MGLRTANSASKERETLTRKQLAERLGIAQQKMAHYDVAKLNFPASLFPDLSQFLERSVDELLGMAAKCGTIQKCMELKLVCLQ